MGSRRADRPKPDALTTCGAPRPVASRQQPGRVPSRPDRSRVRPAASRTALREEPGELLVEIDAQVLGPSRHDPLGIRHETRDGRSGSGKERLAARRTQGEEKLVTIRAEMHVTIADLHVQAVRQEIAPEHPRYAGVKVHGDHVGVGWVVMESGGYDAAIAVEEQVELGDLDDVDGRVHDRRPFDGGRGSTFRTFPVLW